MELKNNGYNTHIIKIATVTANPIDDDGHIAAELKEISSDSIAIVHEGNTYITLGVVKPTSKGANIVYGGNSSYSFYIGDDGKTHVDKS